MVAEINLVRLKFRATHKIRHDRAPNIVRQRAIQV